MPAFVLAREAVVLTDRLGPVTLDVAYGGAFYGVLPAASIGLDLDTSPLAAMVTAATAIKEAASAQLAVRHPSEPDLGYLYGVILTDGADAWDERATTNVCVFADGQVDRSPTGSGVTARLALMHRRGQIGLGQVRRFRSLTGAEFTGQVLEATTAGAHPAIVAEVGGRAFFTGEASFTLEPDDPLGHGFLLRR